MPPPEVKLYLSQLPATHICPLVAFLVTTGSALELGAPGHAGLWQPFCEVFPELCQLRVVLRGQYVDSGTLSCFWPLPLALCLLTHLRGFGPTQEQPLFTKCLYMSCFYE